MGVRDLLWGVSGLLLLGTVLAAALWTAFVLAREAFAALRSRIDDVRSKLTERRRARLRAEERVALEQERLIWRIDEGAVPIVSAAIAGDLLVTGHADGQVRLRCLSRAGEHVGAFETGAANGTRVFLSGDGRRLATAERFQPRLTLRRLDGAPLVTLSPDTSEAFRTWQSSADSLGGYLYLNQHLAGAAFGEDEAGPVLTLAWDLCYGPDGGPSPTFGSAAALIRRHRLVDDEPPRLVAEVLRDLGSGSFARGVMVLPDGRTVIVGGWRIDAATDEACRLPPDLGRPLAATPDGRCVVGEVVRGQATDRCRWGLWDLVTGEQRHAWGEAVVAPGRLGSLSADGRLFAVPVQESRRSKAHPNIAWTASLTRVYEVASGRALATLPVNPLLLAFPPELGLISVEAGGAKLWRL